MILSWIWKVNVQVNICFYSGLCLLYSLYSVESWIKQVFFGPLIPRDQSLVSFDRAFISKWFNLTFNDWKKKLTKSWCNSTPSIDFKVLGSQESTKNPALRNTDRNFRISFSNLKRNVLRQNISLLWYQHVLMSCLTFI